MLPNLLLYQDLLSYLGVEPGNGTPDTDQAIATALNGALQRLYILGPTFLRRNDGRWNVRAPVTINLGVTQGSTALTDGTAITPDMVGCTIRIFGENADNEVVSASQLLAPPEVATGEVAATVYFDSFTLPANVISVSGKALLNETWPIWPAEAAGDEFFTQRPYTTGPPNTHSYDANPNGYSYYRLRVGVPIYYSVQPLQLQVSPNFCQRLRIAPMPAGPFTMKWQQECIAPTVAVADLEAALIQPDGTLSAQPSNYILIPGGTHEITLLPLARMELSANPHFLEEKRAFVQSGAADALTILDKMNPQRQLGMQARPDVFLPN
jgi:hypothetical protein